MMEIQNPLDQQIQTSYQKATAQRKKFETKSSRYTIAGITLSAVATFAAGVPSLIGQPVGGDWRLTCTIVALITLVATIVTSVQNQVAKPGLLASASECVGRLRALLIEMQASDCDYEQLRIHYQGILIDFSEMEL